MAKNNNYPQNTGHEVYISLHLSHKMVAGVGGRATLTKESVGVDYLKSLFATHGIIVSCKPEELPIFQKLNKEYGFNLDLPDQFHRIFLSEEHRRLVVIKPEGLPLKNSSLLQSYTSDQLSEATFSFDKYYYQTEHYDDLVEKLSEATKQAGAMKIKVDLAVAKAKRIENENALLEAFLNRSDS